MCGLWTWVKYSRLYEGKVRNVMANAEIMRECTSDIFNTLKVLILRPLPHFLLPASASSYAKLLPLVE